MLVDLGRNDVGRVSQMGTVKVEKLMEIERYSHVMHISSTVTGKLIEDLNPWDVLRAALPVGTVSGAPKVRAMQIIDDLEVSKRGPYGGGIGYAGFAGEMDIKGWLANDGRSDFRNKRKETSGRFTSMPELVSSRIQIQRASTKKRTNPPRLDEASI